jgi:Ca2+-binding EF-hand superfamily protein
MGQALLACKFLRQEADFHLAFTRRGGARSAMPGPALLLFFAAAVQATPPSTGPIFVTGHAGPPFISPMGEPFRAKDPGEDTLADWFRQADRNGDGVLTIEEMQADAMRFFAKLDTNHDGQIIPDELVEYEWDIAPEIQVNSKLKRARAPAGQRPPPSDDERRRHGGDRYDPYDMDGLQGGARYALLNIPEPVAAADADFDRAITLDEFRQAAIARFQLLDSKHEGRLTLAQLELLLPKIPAPGAKPKHHNDDEADSRVGLPLPKGP